MKPQTMRETPVPRGGQVSGSFYYRLPDKVCATCGQSTSKSSHPKCLRRKGHLVVVDHPPGKKFR